MWGLLTMLMPQRGGGVAPKHHAGHPRESGHTQTAVALVTTLCKLQLAVGPRAFSKDIYLAGRQASFMFWVFLKRRNPTQPHQK